MKLSVIILNYNVRYFLELCLQSVEVAIADLDAEIIVVDNNSIDDSCAMVKSNFPKVRLIKNKENYGFAKGNNIGVKDAKGEYVCVLNPDTVVAEDTFTTILEFADSKTNLGIVGCQLIDGRGKYLPESKRNVPTPKVAFEKLIGNDKNYYANHLERESIGEVDILVGAFMMLKRSIFNEVGGFDERYFMYGEDIDLSYSIKKAGYINYYYGATTILHFKGESTLKNKKYLKRFYGAMGLFYKKHFSQNLFLNKSVKLGTKLFSSFNNRQKNKVIIPDSIISFSELPKLLTERFSIQYKKIKESESIPKNSQLVLSCHSKPFKSIIEIIKRDWGNLNLTFRIWPKNCNFILGSDSNATNGEVIHF
ncbi:glycosyltransferase family 2 protein [Winogradskyella sp. A3E31]|uniref:glycosyltransferase family 2 protein n=1 Tax=Winogradskyella sp. A3E31 TaxID=3349637 RepID=UPI00398AA93F